MFHKVTKKGELIQHLDNYAMKACDGKAIFIARIQVFADYVPTESDVDTRELVEHYSMSYTYWYVFRTNSQIQRCSEANQAASRTEKADFKWSTSWSPESYPLKDGLAWTQS